MNRALALDSVKRSWYKFSKNKISVVGLAIVLAMIFIAVFQSYIAPYPRHAAAYVNFSDANKPPSAQYWLGTDQNGRDILSRIIFSLRSSLVMGMGVLSAAAPVGVIMGLVAGYFRKRFISRFIMRVVDIFLSLPSLVLAMAISSLLRPTLFNSMMAVTFSWWAWYARLTYGMAASVSNENYIRSAEFVGDGHAHILFCEILPNCISPILTKATLDMGLVILIGAALSFVGLGEQPPKPALGTMIAEGSRLLPEYWWIAVFPALAIMIIVLAFNLLGDGITDMMKTDEA